MNPQKAILVSMIAGALVLGAAVVVIRREGHDRSPNANAAPHEKDPVETSRQPTVDLAQKPVESSSPIPSGTRVAESPATIPVPRPPAQIQTPGQTLAGPGTPSTANPTASPSEKKPEDLRARDALRLVGVDPQAEEIWLDAINDPRHTANERRNLIEDLNEDGFADPDHPTAAELPLIERRIRLIDELAPQALDQVNIEAFREARKDLVKMRADLTKAAP